MSIGIFRVVLCDSCGAWGPLGLPTTSEARAVARAQGWTKEAEEKTWDVCPKCAVRRSVVGEQQR